MRSFCDGFIRELDSRHPQDCCEARERPLSVVLRGSKSERRGADMGRARWSSVAFARGGERSFAARPFNVWFGRQLIGFLMKQLDCFADEQLLELGVAIC
jgi:hypothetical protein